MSDYSIAIAHLRREASFLTHELADSGKDFITEKPRDGERIELVARENTANFEAAAIYVYAANALEALQAQETA